MTKSKKKSKMRAFLGWIGLVDDKPYFEYITDFYGSSFSCQIFKTRQEAEDRFEAVRQVQLKDN